jgi:AcrR family transcriptional regulator
VATKRDPKAQRPAVQTREHVLEVAADLFYWQGIRGVGVDRIAAEAGVAPATLYRLFGSRDGLVEAYVERADRLYKDWFDAAVEAGGTDPRDRILALFEALGTQVEPPCRGCPFQMALAELPDTGLPAHRQAVATKAWVRERLGDLTDALAAAMPVDDPDALADQLALVMEGVYASVHALGGEGPAKRARSVVEALLPAA